MKVIITDCDHTSIDIEKKIFNEANLEFELKQCKTEEDLINQCKDGDIFINQYAPITRKVMEKLPNLKMVVRYGVGVNNVDIGGATDLGIQICNVPDYGTNEVADQAIAMMMALVRKVVIMDKYTKEVKGHKEGLFLNKGNPFDSFGAIKKKLLLHSFGANLSVTMLMINPIEAKNTMKEILNIES